MENVARLRTKAAPCFALISAALPLAIRTATALELAPPTAQKLATTPTVTVALSVCVAFGTNDFASSHGLATTATSSIAALLC